MFATTSNPDLGDQLGTFQYIYILRWGSQLASVKNSNGFYILYIQTIFYFLSIAIRHQVFWDQEYPTRSKLPLLPTPSTSKMPLLNRRPAPAYDNTTTPAPRHTLMSRITGRSRRSRPYSNATMAGPATSTTTTHPHHQKRRPSIGDRISGAMLKLRGSLTRRPGKKVREQISPPLPRKRVYINTPTGCWN